MKRCCWRTAWTEGRTEEYAAVLPDPGDPLWEAVRPDDALGRLNLRPFKATSGSVAALSRACLETATRTWGEPRDLRVAWSAFVSLCRAGECPAFPLPQVLELSARLEAQGYPAMHHSRPYAQAYHPAYRLVGKTALASLLRGG